MKNINEIHLEDIINNLRSAHVKLDLEFLRKLLENASQCDKPWRNVVFANKIDCVVNETTNTAIGIQNWLNGNRTIPVSKLIKIVDLSKNHTWKDIENNLISIKSGIKKGEINPKFPLKIDHKIGAIIGHILGDGAINKRGESIFFCNSNPELLREFIKYMKDIFGAEPRIWIQKPKQFEEKTLWLKRVSNIEDVPKNHVVGLFYPKICVDIIKTIFGNFADGKNKFITREIKNSNLNFKKGLVRAFFDDEGTVERYRIGIRVFQDREEILKDIQIILSEFNILCNSIKYYFKKSKKRYYLDISNYKNCYKFHQQIGFTTNSKNLLLASSINRMRNGSKQNYIRNLETK